MRTVYSASELSEGVDRIAKALLPELLDSEHPPMVISVLHGAMSFSSDVVRRLPLLLEMHYVVARSYVGEHRGSFSLEFESGLCSKLWGRTALVLDCMSDSGQTLERVCAAVLDCGARCVSACMVRRRGSKYEPTAVGFEYDGSDFLLGYGLDKRGLMRNLPYIGVEE